VLALVCRIPTCPGKLQIYFPGPEMSWNFSMSGNVLEKILEKSPLEFQACEYNFSENFDYRWTILVGPLIVMIYHVC
jgi:hypothetical protein